MVLGKDSGNLLKTAESIKATGNFSRSLNRDDRVSYYRFNVSQHSHSTVRLKQLTGDADLALLDSKAKPLRRSKRQGDRNEVITSALKPGNYVLQVINRSGETSYQLKLSSSPIKLRQKPSSMLRGLNGSGSRTPAIQNYTSTSNLSSSQSIDYSRLTQQASSNSSTVIRLTNDGNSYFPHISGSSIVWRGSDYDDREIFLYDGNRTTQLTNNDTYDSDPQVSNSHVAWINRSGNDAEIVLHSRSTGATTQITENRLLDDNLQISGSTIAWTTTYPTEAYTTERDIRFSINGAEASTVSSRIDFDDFNPKISGSFIAFERNQISGDAEDGIYLYNITNGITSRLSSNSPNRISLGGISGSNVVWSEFDGNDNEIFLFNGSQTIQLTNNNVDDLDPQISSSNVVWQRWNEDEGRSIYLYNGNTTTLLSSGDSKNARISGSNIVWQQNQKIFFYDGAQTTQIAEYDANDRAEALLSISDSNVVWLNYNPDGATGYDIYYARAVRQSDFSRGIINGLNTYLSRLDNAFSSRVLQNSFPLIGSQLRNSPVSRFIDTIRSKINNTFQAANPLSNSEVRQAIFNALGNSAGGLNILQDLNGDRIINISDIRVNTRSSNVEFQLRIGQTFVPFNTPLTQSLGLPRLGFNLNGNTRVRFNYGLDLKFGYQTSGSASNRFYIETSNPNEFTVGLNVSTPGLNAVGSLGILKVRAIDQGTNLRGQFSIDLRDSNDTGSQLTVAELQGLSSAGILNASLAGNADVKLNLVTNFPVQARFPSLKTNFRINWSLGSASLDPNRPRTLGGVPRIEFNNVRLDIGTFLSNFVSPIFGEIRKVTKPVQPVIQFLTKPLPVISKFAKRNITLLDIAELVAKSNPSLPRPDFRYIRAAAEIVNLANSIPTGNNLFVDLGSFSLGSADARSSSFNLTGINPAIIQTAPRWSSQLQGSRAFSFINRTQGNSAAGQFNFPILTDPNTAFNLLLGKTNTKLFTYRMPSLSFTGRYTQFAPILGPLGVSITGTVGARINFEFGFDTFGLQQYSRSNNVNDLFTGFYVDADPRKPAHVNVFTGLDAGPAINLAIADFSIVGGVVGTINFRLKDDGDLKVRANELINNFRGDPLGRDLFTTSGAVIAGLTARASVIGLGGFEENLASVTLLTYGGNPRFKENNGKAKQSDLQKLARLGITALMGPAPIAISLVRRYGPTLVNAIQKAGVARDLRNAANKGRQAATKAAKTIDRELGKARRQAIAQVRRAGLNPARVTRKVERITVQKAAPAIKKAFKKLRF
jgi:hypothetical protein